MLVIKAFMSSFQELQTALSDYTSIFKHTAWKFPSSHLTPVVFWQHNSKIEPTVNSDRSIFPQLNASESIDSLKKDGFALGLSLPPDVIREIVSTTRNLPCYGDRKNDRNFYYS